MFQRKSGIVPVNKFPARFKSVNPVKLTKDSGIVPLKSLSSRLRSIRLATNEISSGRVPLNLLSSRSVKYKREETLLDTQVMCTKHDQHNKVRPGTSATHSRIPVWKTNQSPLGCFP